MKRNFTTYPVIKSILLHAIAFTISVAAFCQPDYDFRNSTLVSGTALQVNAVYLFQNVKPGVDATVTITDMTGGIYLSNIDGGSGYVEALQPVLQVPANSSGYVELQIDFLVGGTNTPMIQTEIPATPIDVDGQVYADGEVNEFDILQLTNGYVDYDMLGGELNMNINSSWVTGINTRGIDYPGVDTTPRQVMFTTVNANLSSFIFRTGATSAASGLHQRLRSLYFKKFFYPNSFLPVSSLSYFNGNNDGKKISMQWIMASGNSIRTATIERSSNAIQFTGIGDEQMNTGTASSNLYNFTDNTSLQGTIYYRLKMTDLNGKVSYSNTLVFNMNDNTNQLFKIYPSLINDNATINIKSANGEQASVQFFDMSGRYVYQKKIALQQGFNSISINGLSSLQKGAYTAIVRDGNTMHSQKIMIE
jgi:hypothetical protein